MRKFVLYVSRWQLSTPILWLVVSGLGTSIEATVIANLIGASIFFWVDKVIFRSNALVTWEVTNDSSCDDCGAEGKLRRLVLAPGGRSSGAVYDKRLDPNPEFRCLSCSDAKLSTLRLAQKVGAVSPAGML